MNLNGAPVLYLFAMRENPSLGVILGKRPEPTLNDARSELSEAISVIALSLFKDKYGPLLGAISQPAVNEFLKTFESNLSRAKGDLTLVLEELFERVVQNNLRKRN
jgi:hypothetical protein